MKKTKKILLSLLAVFGLFFMTNTVNAENASLTQEEFDSVVPDTMNVSMTKTEFAKFIMENESKKDTGDYAEDPLEKEVLQKLDANLQEKGFSGLDSSIFRVYTEFWEGYGDLERVSVSLKDHYYDEKCITVKFVKESNFSTEDETYVKNKVNSIEFAKYENVDAVFTIYNLGDEENASKWDLYTYDYDSLLNDDTITIMVTSGEGGFGGGTPWGAGANLYFFKNDVLYATKFVMSIGAYGTTLENGTPVNMASVEKNDELYKELAKELEKKGLTNILGCYELTAYGTIGSDTKVSFNLGTNYNGKEVQILHKKHDGSYEIFKTTVNEGKATITVNEFSPFIIALSNSTEATTTQLNNAPNNAQTSSLDVIFYSILAIGSLTGIVSILVSKRKRMA